jgi:DNA-binding HxlR family transcriptional regulator
VPVDADLLRSLRALADASRLRIVGLLVGRPMAVEELASSLALTPATVVHHLARLREAGLVESRAVRPFVHYSLRLDRLHEVARQLAAAANHPEVSVQAPGPDGTPMPAYDAKVLRAFVDGERLTRIPAQERKRRVLLRWIASRSFVEERPYAEREVNERLARLHEDVASLRRYLVGAGFMEREGGVYRMRPRETWPQD